MSALVLRDALPVQRTAKSKQKCETVSRGRKDERTPPAELVAALPEFDGCLSEPRLVGVVLRCQRRGVRRGEAQR